MRYQYRGAFIAFLFLWAEAYGHEHEVQSLNSKYQFKVSMEGIHWPSSNQQVFEQLIKTIQWHHQLKIQRQDEILLLSSTAKKDEFWDHESTFLAKGKDRIQALMDAEDKPWYQLNNKTLTFFQISSKPTFLMPIDLLSKAEWVWSVISGCWLLLLLICFLELIKTKKANYK